MASKGEELEVKFYEPDLEGLKKRLEQVGGKLDQPRVREVNLRFDTPDRSLTRAARVLRLRQDTRARLTYKGPGSDQGGAQLRQELEFTVGDYDMAKRFIEALGYEVALMYEKYRTTYAFEGCDITLDEMPYGTFAEIEGPGEEQIRSAARKLRLDWERRILDSYTSMFERLKRKAGLTFRDLSFENFKGIRVSPEMLGVSAADTDKD
jgi:adenylate cyclase, class 2